jgi:hypothetical protein
MFICLFFLKKKKKKKSFHFVSFCKGWMKTTAQYKKLFYANRADFDYFLKSDICSRLVKRIILLFLKEHIT